MRFYWLILKNKRKRGTACVFRRNWVETWRLIESFWMFRSATNCTSASSGQPWSASRNKTISSTIFFPATYRPQPPVFVFGVSLIRIPFKSAALDHPTEHDVLDLDWIRM